MRWLRRNALRIYAGLAVLYMLIPIVVIAVFSFAETPKDKLNFAINDGFTLEYWQHAFGIEELNDALRTSLELAALSTVISTAIGTLMALALVRYDFFGRRASNLLIILPMATPEIVMGASLLSLFIFYSAPLGFTTLLIAHVMFCISFVVVVVRSRLIGFDRSLEEAARDLGATPRPDLPLRDAAIDPAGGLCRRPARLRALDRRLRDLELQLRDNGDLPPLRVRRRSARHPGTGQRDRHDAFHGHRSGDPAGDLAAAPRGADGVRSAPSRRESLRWKPRLRLRFQRARAPA